MFKLLQLNFPLTLTILIIIKRDMYHIWPQKKMRTPIGVEVKTLTILLNSRNVMSHFELLLSH